MLEPMALQALAAIYGRRGRLRFALIILLHLLRITFDLILMKFYHPMAQITVISLSPSAALVLY